MLTTVSHSVRCLQCWCLFTSQSMITFTPQSKQKKKTTDFINVSRTKGWCPVNHMGHLVRLAPRYVGGNQKDSSKVCDC